MPFELSCHISLKVLMIEGGEEEKRGILTDFIVKMDPSDKVMVFVGKKSRADDISSDLSLQGKGFLGKNIEFLSCLRRMQGLVSRQILRFHPFPRGLAVRISGFHPGGPGSIPGVGTNCFFSSFYLDTV